MHLLLGLDPEHIRLEPYTPTLHETPFLSAKEVEIDVNPHAWIYISPCVGSYVGGDITSGLLCTDLAEAGVSQLLSDEAEAKEAEIERE